MLEEKRPLEVFFCHAHIIPLWDADRDPVRGLYTRLTKDIHKRTSKRTYGHKQMRPFQSVNP